MKYIMMTMMAILATAGTMYAQPGPGSPGGPGEHKKVERLKIAFLTERLDLSVEESQKFWPVYNEFQGEKESVEKRIHGAMSTLKDSSKNESDVQQAIDDVHAAKRDMIALEERYLEEVLKVLGPEKTVTLIHSEEKFKREIIRRLQQQRENRQGDRPQRGNRP